MAGRDFFQGALGIFRQIGVAGGRGQITGIGIVHAGLMLASWVFWLRTRSHMRQKVHSPSLVVA